ncbi:MAG: AMP-dependent synthetase and ligase [Rhizobacter sp.]|nr:AMP-dependent synthetase and ligase [Rhizobacter sp.]
MQRFATLQDILSTHAREDRQIALIDGENEQRAMSFLRLRQRALGLLGALQRRGYRPGDSMILCLGDNERFLEMFWACVLGGIVPVPLAPAAADEQRRKLLRVFAQLGRTSVCIDAQALERLDGFAASHGLADEAMRLRSCAVIPGSLDSSGAAGEPSETKPDDLAFIQFSSGSTGQPKGVLLTHRNLTANIASIIEGAAFTDRDVALSWMPLSHDMGLIGFHLSMLACGASHAIMRTDLFARRPLMWLEQASLRRATLLCSPNFGYQHYLKQHALKQYALKQDALKPLQRLDLSSVRLIFNGAEPISADVCRQFLRTMAPHGLKANAMFAVYGLAEASLAVSFPVPGTTVESLELDRTVLRVGEQVRLSTHGPLQPIEFVKLGRPLPGVEVRIVGEDEALLDDRAIGHVQIRGENVTKGFYGDGAERDSTLSVDGWLDTGDLGFFWDGQLVITGRAKDLIIVNGQNYYPSDLERIAEQVPGINANRVAAAGVRGIQGGTEELALFVLHRGNLADFASKAMALERTINQQTGLTVAWVVPVTHIPKTTSGKLQRYALAEAYELGNFNAALAELAPFLSLNEVQHLDDSNATPMILQLTRICEPLIPNRQISSQTNLLEINLNSLTLARIHEAIEREFPNRIEVTDLLDYPTLGQLATLLETSRP